MKPRGAVVVVFGLLLAGCAQNAAPDNAKATPPSSRIRAIEIFVDGNPVELTAYLRTQSVAELANVPEDVRNDIKRSLSPQELNALPPAKRQLIVSAKPDLEPVGKDARGFLINGKAVDALTFARSVPSKMLELSPEGFRQSILEGLTKAQLKSLPLSVQRALTTAR